MIESRSKWGEIIKGVGLHLFEVIDQNMELYTPGISNLLKIESSDSAQKHFTGKVSENRLRRKDEGESTDELGRFKTYVTSVDYTAYADKLEITREQLMDRDFTNVMSEAADLGRAASFSQDESGIQLFNAGWTTRKDSAKGYRMQWYNDTVPQWSTLHPSVVPGQSTQSNASSTGIALTDGNLETARIALMLQTTDAGGPMSLGGQTTLVVPAHLEKTARVITESELVSNSGNNDINIYKGSINVASSMLLDAVNGGSDTAWYLIVPGSTKFIHDVREGMQPWTEVDEDKKTLTVGIYGRFANYTKDWRRSWGSLGAGAAYSA